MKITVDTITNPYCNSKPLTIDLNGDNVEFSCGTESFDLDIDDVIKLLKTIELIKAS